ncbi:putative transcription factor bHLH family [Helianthus anomalus]
MIGCKMGEAIREKISERMKLLQAIVPGCDKALPNAASLMKKTRNFSLQNHV